jgi:D-glycero-D-manno-heptose 1,7-bisphosphate phosphatase
MAPGLDSVKLIILDRDGVVNEDSDDYIKSADEWVPIPGSIEAIAALHKAGFIVVIATNQSGISRKYFDEFDLTTMHEKMSSLVEEEGGQISGVFFCPHGPDDDCDCRKPRTGLLKQIECEFGTSVAGAPFVGDSEKDLLAAKLAGCQPVLVQTGKGARTALELAPGELSDLVIYPDLAAYVESLLQEK